MLIGAIVLGIGTFAPRWDFAAWAKTAIRIIVVALLGYVAIAIILSSGNYSWSLFWALNTIKSILLGVSGGVLLLFFITGEAARGWRRVAREKNRTNR